MANFLGADPPSIPVVLTAGADFYDFIDYKVAGVLTDWPDGTTLSLEFDSGESWEATIVDSRATWQVDKDVADTINDHTVVWMLYVNGTDDQVLTLSRVERRR